MAVPVLIIGASGTGKSCSLRNCCNDNWNIIRVLNKPLPFRGHIKGIQSNNYDVVKRGLSRSTALSIVIDDAGYLITNSFMKGHSNLGPKDDTYKFYNRLADEFYGLIEHIYQLPEDKIIYIVMHEDMDNTGTIKSKTVGKLLDDKVCIEGCFSIVFRCIEESGSHYFITQNTNKAISKTPVGMFDSLMIDNDLSLVDHAIREYYEMPDPNANANENAEEAKEE